MFLHFQYKTKQLCSCKEKNKLIPLIYSTIDNKYSGTIKPRNFEQRCAIDLLNSNTSKVDFILYTDEGIIPVEVKAGKSTQAKSLSVYSNLYNPKYAIRISAKDFGYNPETKIKSVPLYAVFLI